MTDHDQAEAEFVRRLLHRPRVDLDQPSAPAAPAGHVPREGTTTSRTRPADYGDREFVGQLFGTHENARNAHNDPDNIPPRTVEHL